MYGHNKRPAKMRQGGKEGKTRTYPFGCCLRLDYCGFGPFCSTGTTVIYFTFNGTHMYHISIKRQIIRLSIDINNIRMDKRILLKIN